MANYVLSCCSTCDLTDRHLQSRNLEVIFFHFELDGKQYPDDLGKSMPFADFYKAMAEDKMTRTSQVNVDEFERYFESFLSKGKDVLHVSLSSGISGACNSAMIAAESMKEKYPNNRVVVVDSLAASSGYGLLMDAMADKRDEGMSLDELTGWVEQNKLRLHHWFFTSDLKYLVRGGRVSKMAGTVGSLLNICPLLNVDANGKLAPKEKVRTKRKVIKAMADRLAEHVQDGENYTGKVYFSHSDCFEDAKAVADLVKAAHPKMDGYPLINWIGTTIGSHTGPGTVAMFFWGDVRE